MAAATVPPVGHSIFLLLLQMAVLLLAARLGAELCRRMALPAVLGELAAGIVLGPSVLGSVAPQLFSQLFPPNPGQFLLLDAVGTLGMVLLMLLTGLETDLRLLRNLGRAALIASTMGMVFPFATGFGLGLFMPESYLAQPDRRILFSLFLATAMAISAMPVIAKILHDLDLTRRNIGVVILSAGVVDDTAGWLVLSVIAGLASHGQVRLGQLLFTLLLTGAFVAVAGFVLYPAARKLIALTRRFRTPDSDLVVLIVVTLLCGAATEWIGIHAIFGAFIAGTLFRQVAELSTDAVRRLESFVYAVLAPVFFATVGLKVNLLSLESWSVLGLVLTIACLGKLIGCTVGSIWGGLRFWEGLSIAVAMNARGAMELVVATIGLSMGILNQQMFSIIVMVAIVTTFMAPVGLRLTMRKVRMTEDEQKRILVESSKGAFDPARVRVLVPTMGGPNVTGAILLAAGLSQRSVHAVEVLSVKAPTSLLDRFLRLFDPSRRREEETDRPSGLQRTLTTAGLTPTVREVNHSDVAAAIVQEAQKGFDLIVLGASSHGRWLGGAVLEDVVRRAPCHVCIVKTRGEEQKYSRILACFDGGVFSRVAVEFAVRYADVAQAALTVAVLGPLPGSQPGEAEESANGIDDEALRRITPIFSTVQQRPRVLQLSADLYEGALANEAASGAYDLVVIGAENRAIQHRLYFGADNERLLRSAPVTVALVVPSVGLLH
jgi:Kef-type K+ transport system membrane component KefB/nucleotide-binding universal stress UspA family protein